MYKPQLSMTVYLRNRGLPDGKLPAQTLRNHGYSAMLGSKEDLEQFAGEKIQEVHPFHGQRSAFGYRKRPGKNKNLFE